MTNKIEVIERKLIIESPQHKIWQALTSPGKLSQWFGQSAEFKLEPKSIGWFGWDDHGKFAMRIEHVEPESYFAWRWMDKKDTPFVKDQSTFVEWQLKALAPNQTELYMKESEFKSPESRNDNDGGWTEELAHLLGYLGD